MSSIDRRFALVPLGIEQAKLIGLFQRRFKTLAQDVDQFLGKSREAALALTKLEEGFQWTIQGLSGQVYDRINEAATRAAVRDRDNVVDFPAEGKR